MVLACLIALLNRDHFIDGPREALPFIANLAQNFPYTIMSLSQERYLNYFSQVLLKDFTPLSGPLVLSKILIVLDEEEIDPQQSQTAGQNEDSDEEIDGSKRVRAPIIDYSRMTEKLFFRIF